MFNNEMSQIFINFEKKECKGSSLLYEHLAYKIAKDESLLELCRKAQKGQPVPNLLFGAVHYLLLSGKEHPLKEYYPSIVDQPKSHKESFESFRDFCFTYRDEMELILSNRLVQTNEVRRCAYLYPAFCAIYKRTEKPLALIEIGTSAGLQLLWDQYSYTYEDNMIYGNKESKLTISAKVKGDYFPYLHRTPPPVSTRIGLDLNTIDLNDEDEKLWLKSLIWPEHKERLYMFEEAATIMKENNVKLINDDGVSSLTNRIEDIPMDSVVCIFHTHVANQMPIEVKKNLLQVIEAIGKQRDVFHIYNNVMDRDLHLDYYIDGILSQHTIAETDGHGRWFKWLLESELPISQ